MLILAGISIQAITNTGLFEAAGRAKKEAKRAQVVEWLNLKLVEKQSENTKGTDEDIIKATQESVKTNISELETIGKDIVVEDTKTEEDGEKADIYFYVQVDKDVYKVDIKGAKFIGEAGKFPPIIKIESITSTTNSITVKVSTKRNEGGKIELYIKAEDEEKYNNIKTDKNVDNMEFTYTGLEQNKKYNIKIVAIAENKQTTEVTKENIQVGNVPELTTKNVEFTYSPGSWTNGSVTVTAKLKGENAQGYTLKITDSNPVGASKTTALGWKNASEGITVSANKTIYAVLIDNEGQIGGAATGNVDKIDTTKPSNITISTVNTTTSTIDISVTASDIAGKNEKASGIKEYRFSSDNGNTWSKYQTSGNYKFKNLYTDFGTTYNIKVEVKDNAGNTAIESKNTSTSLNNEYIIENAGSELIRYNYNSKGTGEYRILTKTNSGKAIAGICYIDKYVAPVVVSTDINAVSYCTTDSGDNVFTSSGNIEWNGTKYYYSSNGYWIEGKRPFASKLRNINKDNEKFDTLAIAAKELLTKYYNNTTSGYEVNYNINSNVENITEKSYFNSGDSVTLSTNRPQKDGYHFLGWSTSYNSTNATYLPGDTYTFNQSTTLYAIWGKHDFSDQSGICTICKKDMNYLTATKGGENWNSGQILNCATGFDNVNDCCRGYFNGSWNIHSSFNLYKGAFDRNGGIGSASDYSSTDGNVCMIIYKNAIDVTNMDKIIFKCQLDENADWVTNKTKIGLCNSNSLSKASDYYNFQQSTEVTDKTMSAATYVLQLDVSKYTGNYYLKVTLERLGGSAEDYTAATKINSMYPVYK